MREIQFLYIEDCPNSEPAWDNLLACLVRLGIGIHPQKILIHDDLEADHYSFQGSPSFKIDGKDLWEKQSSEYHLGCRVYSTKTGLVGCPTVKMLIDRIKQVTNPDSNS